MKLKVDPEKLKARLQQQEESAQARKNDPRESFFVKALEAGTLNFRAVPYPHSDDPSSEPFAERSYHFIPRIGYVYCPKENAGEECHLCNFCWDRAKATKGTEAVKDWLKCLPSLYVLIPGIIREREEEGVKFLKITTRKDKHSDKYNKIYRWFFKEGVEQWMNPDKGESGGYDIEINFDEPDSDQAKYLKLKKGSVILKSIDLARKSTPFGKKGEYESFVETIPNVDETDPFSKKTTEDTLALLEKWNEFLQKKAPPKTEVELNKNEGTSVSGVKTPVDDVDALREKLASLGLDS